MNTGREERDQSLVEGIELRAGDVRLPGRLYRPATAVPAPAVVVAPGGLAQGDVDAYAWAGERLAKAGFAALILTYHAATPYGDPDDVSAAVDWLGQDSRVAPERIGALGHSRGGLAVLGAAAAGARLKALVPVAAPADIAEYVGALAGFFPAARDAVVQFMTGEPEAIPEEYASVSALRLAKNIRQPVLLVHGAADMRTSLHHSQQIETALRAAGNQEVRLEVVPGMGHYFEFGTLGYQFDRVMDLVTEWLSKEL